MHHASTTSPGAAAVSWHSKARDTGPEKSGRRAYGGTFGSPPLAGDRSSRFVLPAMNTQLLIDNIVRQMTVLIAQLATTGGVRAPLAHIANQVFLELTRELAAQGISQKVSADMFGIALRSYRRRVQRLAASETERGHSLWEAILDYLTGKPVVTREQVVHRFRYDDEAQVRAVLRDLCESGLVFKLGSGSDTAYRAATESELAQLRSNQTSAKHFVWLMIYRKGPITLERLHEETGVDPSQLEPCLDALVADERIERVDDGTYSSRAVVLPLDASAGWETGMFDHFQAMVKTLCQRLREVGEPNSQVGGSTYSFRVWPGHPHEDEVLSSLERFRSRYTALRAKVQAYNATHTLPTNYQHVTIYSGQCCVEQEEDE